MNRMRLYLAMMSVLVIVLVCAIVLLLMRRDTDSDFCVQLLDGTKQCHASSALYFSELTDGQIVIADDVPLRDAVATFEDWRATHSFSGEIAISTVGTVTPQPVTSTPVNSFCPNMPDGSVQCFAHASDFIAELSNGQLILPTDIAVEQAIATHGAWAQSIRAPQTVQPTAPPGLGTAFTAEDIATFEASTFPWENQTEQFLFVACAQYTLPQDNSGRIRCFESTGDMLDTLSDGAITDVPDDTNIYQAEEIYRAWAAENDVVYEVKYPFYLPGSSNLPIPINPAPVN